MTTPSFSYSQWLHEIELSEDSLIFQEGLSCSSWVLNPLSLLVAVGHGRWQCTHDLLAAGASPNASDDLSGIPLILATRHGHDSLVDLLIQQGADVNIQSVRGQSALMNAARYHRSSILKNLIRAGAQLDLQNEKGCTALMTAARYGSEACLVLLIQAGASPFLCNSSGQNVLDWVKKDTLSPYSLDLLESYCFLQTQSSSLNDSKPPSCSPLRL